LEDIALYMDRKRFLSSFVAAGIPVAGFPSFFIKNEEDVLAPIVPRYLKPGDTIGITCPAGTITPEEIQPAMIQMV